MEPVYIWLYNHSHSYVLFRMIIWGSAIWLLLRTFRRLQVNMDVAIAFFSMASLIWFSYARVSLSFALMFFGLALISTKSKTLFSNIFGLLLVWASFYFHKSAPFGMAIVLFSLVISIVRSKYVPVLLLLFVIVAISIYTQNIGGLFESFTEVDNESLSNYASAGSYYVGDNEGSRLSLFAAAGLLRVIEVLVFVLDAILSMMLIMRYGDKEMPYSIRCFTLSVLLIFVTSAVIGIASNEFLGTVHIRLLRFCIIPAIVVFTYSYQNGYFRKFCSFLFYFCCLSSFAHVLYSWYCTIG